MILDASGEQGVAAARGLPAASRAVLTAGFAFTGVGTVALGVLLPSLAANGRLGDDRAGLLFLMQFAGSTLGAALSGADRRRGLLVGYGVLAVSSGVLAFAGFQALHLLFFLFGLGLGMAMTSTSLLFSDRYGDERARKLEGLNFAWAAGAIACPLLLPVLVKSLGLSSFFLFLSGVAVLAFLWVLVRERNAKAAAKPEISAAASASLGWMLPLVIMVMCSVGVESALSGWLTTYAHRADASDASGAAIATSLFWLGMLLSRLACSTRLLAILGRGRLLTGLLVGAAIAVGLLIESNAPGMIRVAAALAGLSIGPLYPLLLSFLLERVSRGWFFAMAGLGAALFPWMTGMLSAHMGSLHYGLLAPLAGALAMIALRVVSLAGERTEMRSEGRRD